MNERSDDLIQVLTAIDSKEIADTIARQLVERRLAACVQVLGPVSSTYRWQGVVESAEEWLCLVKTSTERYPDVERAIRQLHPYDVPEVLAVPVVAGSAPYIAWLREGVSHGAD